MKSSTAKSVQRQAGNKQKSNSKAVANNLSREGAANPAIQLEDHRPEAIAQRKVQAMINNSPQVRRTAQIQAVSNSPTSPPFAILKSAPSPSLQRAVKARVVGESYPASYNDLDTLCGKFGIEKTALAEPIKTRLFTKDLFPQAYKDTYDGNRVLREEMENIVAGLDDLVLAASSSNIIVAASGDADAVGKQLFAIIGNSIDDTRLQGFPHYKLMKSMNVDDHGTYSNLLETLSAKLNEYEGQISHTSFDLVTLKKNSRMEARIEALKARADALKEQLESAIASGEEQAPALAGIQLLVDEIGTYEKAWDLDWGMEDLDIEGETDVLARDARVKGFYDEEGGVDDDEEVTDDYASKLACTLFAILAVKGSWLGTDRPEVLHHILRKTGKLKMYDDNRVAAEIRYMAGFTPTPIGGKTLNAYLREKVVAQQTDNFIADVAGEAHTFAAMWRGTEYKRADEAGSNSTFGGYGTKELLCIWEL